MEKARACVDQNKPEEAGRLLSEIIMNPGISPGEQRAGALELLARCQVLTLDNAAAQRSLDMAVAECDLVGMAEHRDACLLLGAALQLADKSLKQAQATAGECLTRAREQGWKQNEARALEVLGKVAKTEQDYPAALEYLDQAAKLYVSLGLETEGYELALPRARALYGLGRDIEARERLVELLDFYGRNFIPARYVRQLLTKAYSAWLDGETELFARFSTVIIEESHAHGRPLMLACGYCDQGLAALNTGDYKVAREWFVKTWRIVSKVYENRLQVNTLTGMAICSIHLNNPHEALEFTMLARDNLKDGAGLMGRLLPSYSAITHLASNLVQPARTEWNRRPRLELRGPVYYHRQWQTGLLRHIQSGFYWTKIPLGPEAINLAGQWLHELESWRG